ncbi:nucleoside phosphatase GDA1/CD39 [Thamnocephalis sphaerospora]|uniref:guanosine-diphosphatase n=1 Tax=Thamnocephalis sphaerospora TaxID=78915 RepID=A0A4P9XR13_9FUNG|nr:nucleoside phosphatase GDA1/CD39 [Thamnocephalis sphaerospora]|eukprot:RKP08495.1 nucleoside phosphatase GDA1/CD39 [Thamnocephalis sphaerospora]
MAHRRRSFVPAASAAGLTSTRCSQPYPEKPLVQYVLVVDAGSTGSRIHVYRFNHCHEQPELEHEVFHHIKPGLSAYPDDPEAAAHSLDPLLDVALANVPPSQHHCTPIVVKATAGLRLLSAGKGDIILEHVRARLTSAYPFPVVKKDGVVIMDGKEEGVYAWITVNYLLENLGAGERKQTAGVFDLGGGSTQIVFEPALPVGHVMAPGEHEYDLQFGGFHYMLYQHSYLGYGLMEARRRIKQQVVDRWHQDGHLAQPNGALVHPCLSQGHHETITTDSKLVGAALIDAGKNDKVELAGGADGLERCREVVRAHLFDKSGKCPVRPCAFDGIYQPSLQHTFDHGDIYVFSYFYDRLSPLGFGQDFLLGDVREAAEHVCRGDYAWFESVKGAEDLARRFNKNPSYCLDMTFIYSLLRDGYEIPDDRRVHMAKKLQGYETGWCVGAAIAVLDEGQYCSVRELD